MALIVAECVLHDRDTGATSDSGRPETTHGTTCGRQHVTHRRSKNAKFAAARRRRNGLRPWRHHLPGGATRRILRGCQNTCLDACSGRHGQLAAASSLRLRDFLGVAWAAGVASRWSYASITEAGIRPRSAILCPCSRAHARIAVVRSRSAPGRGPRGAPLVERRSPRTTPADRAALTKGARTARSSAACSSDRSISYPRPSRAKTTVSSAPCRTAAQRASHSQMTSKAHRRMSQRPVGTAPTCTVTSEPAPISAESSSYRV